MSIDDLLEQEVRCRRLAAQASDDALRLQLLRLADEYAAAAAALKTDEPKPEPPLSSG